MFVSKSEERQFQPKKIAPKKGRGSFRRHNKHKVRLA